MKTIEEIKNWLLKNAVNDEGDLYLVGLDLSDFDGNVFISSMKVKNDLFQSFQIVGKNLYQTFQNVGEDFYDHKLEKNEYWDESKFYVARRKKLQKITKQKLAEMGYELEEE